MWKSYFFFAVPKEKNDKNKLTWADFHAYPTYKAWVFAAEFLYVYFLSGEKEHILIQSKKWLPAGSHVHGHSDSRQNLRI